MNESLSIAANNLTSVSVLVFILGFVAARFKSDIRIPDPVYQIISVYLLFGIGLKGGALKIECLGHAALVQPPKILAKLLAKRHCHAMLHRFGTTTANRFRANDVALLIAPTKLCGSGQTTESSHPMPRW